MVQDVLLSGRRDFLKIFPVGAAVCMGCASALGRPLSGKSKPDGQHKFQKDSGMSHQEVMEFAFMGSMPFIQNLAEVMGKEKFMASLQKAADMYHRQWAEELFKGIAERNLANLKDATIKLIGSSPYENYLSYKITQDTDKVLELTYSECLMAKILRKMKADDFGYIMQCTGGAPFASVYNPKLKFSNPKNLMKGDEVCIEHYSMV